MVVSRNLPTNSVQFELSEHLPHLFKHIYSQLQVACAGDLAKFGVGVGVWRILAVLWEHADLSHRELSAMTSVEVSTLSRVSKAIKRDGLIRRTRAQADQRTVRVTLTERGRTLTQSIIPSALAIQAEIVQNLSSEDVENLTRILRVIVQNLNAYSETDDNLGEAPASVKPAFKVNRIGKGVAKSSGKSA